MPTRRRGYKDKEGTVVKPGDRVSVPRDYFDREETSYSATLSLDVLVLWGSIITISKSNGRAYVKFDVDGKGVSIPVADLSKSAVQMTISEEQPESTIQMTIAEEQPESTIHYTTTPYPPGKL